MTVRAGTFVRIYDPSVGEAAAWYINDHTFVYDPLAARWHLFGITHAEPAEPKDERSFAHASAPDLRFGPWTKHPPALQADPAQGELFIWAPHVIRHDGRYWMFYAAGTSDPTRFQMKLAISEDLFTWVRIGTKPLFVDGYGARDPCVVQIGEGWVMYYCATSEPDGGNHIVACRESHDLVNWGARRTVFTDAARGTSGGPTESPFVVEWGEGYYLFIGPRGGYVGTDVFFSRNPLGFERDGVAGHIEAHAAEVVEDIDGTWVVSSAGWGCGGVHLADLHWSG